MIEHKTISLADQVFEHLENDILRLSKKLEELKPKFQKAEESRAKENKGLKGHFDRFCEENRQTGRRGIC